jgi:predicted lipid-binding transport protein (Tim44 family)
MLRIRRLPLLALLAVVAALSFSVVSADARSSGSFGSRGSRTFSAPPATNTAPRAARPMERSMTQPGQAQTRAATAGQTSAARPGLFGGGLLGGLAAGFIGAGLFGLLFGHGFLGGMAGFASIIGLLLQVALIVIVARLAWAWWQRRNGMATAGGPSLRQGLDGGSRPGLGAGLGSGFAGLGGGASAPAPAGEDIEIAGEDFDAFERLLSEIQAAYGKEDLSALRARLTPEMLSYFSEDLAQNASRGVVNEVADVKLLQGDLAEAWREGNDEYATVAMRYALTDRMVDRTSGKVVEEGPSEATELWTFRRARGGQWLLSAIQQTD